MNYTKIKQEIESEHEKMADILNNNVYFTFMDELEINIDKEVL